MCWSVVTMQVCYNKLWKILIYKKLRKIDLRDKTHISTTSLAKLGKEQDVSMDVLRKICVALNCNIGDIVDFIPEDHVSTQQLFPNCETNKK